MVSDSITLFEGRLAMRCHTSGVFGDGANVSSRVLSAVSPRQASRFQNRPFASRKAWRFGMLAIDFNALESPESSL